MVACPSCAQDNPEIARFCLACGTKLSAPSAAQEERRVITVIFIDLVGFTSRAEKLDPEDVSQMLDLYYERAKSDIESFGGVVEKFIGDAVMAVFGAPTAHGDDPERAVRAAFAVIESVAALNAEHAGLDLQVRVAVNTGEALVNVAPEPGQGLAAGDVINTASRLQQHAPVDGVVVGEETFLCTRGVIAYAELPPVIAKGKAAPVRAWVATEVLQVPLATDPTSVPLVARERELRILREAWDRVVSDRRLQLVTVFGPSGIGKTRLGTEFSGHVSGSGGLVLRGRCLPYRDSGPYGAFASQVKQIVGIFDNDDPEVARAKLASAVEDVVGADQAELVTQHLAVLLGLGDGDAGDREAIFFSVRCFVEGLAARHPLLLVFEDLHWADGSLLDLVELLAARLHSAPVMLLVLARPELLSNRERWGSGLPSYFALTLEPLTDRDARQLAAYLLASVAELQRERQVAHLAATAEGNPLFLEQLAAALSEQSGAMPSSLPTTIRGIVTARLDVLPAEERALLVDASVVGRVFWRGAVARGRDEPTLTRLLAGLEARDLIHRDLAPIIGGEQQYAFKHGMIRDAAYDTLPRRRRTERHAEVAQYLEEAHVAGAEGVAAMARHWRDGGHPERAFGYFVTAAEQAEQGWAKDIAAVFYGEALACLPDDDSRRRSMQVKQAMAAAAAMHVIDVRDLIR